MQFWKLTWKKNLLISNLPLVERRVDWDFEVMSEELKEAFVQSS